MAGQVNNAIQEVMGAVDNLEQHQPEAHPADSELSSDGTQRTKCPACRNPIRLGIAEADHQPLTTSDSGAWGMFCPHCKKALVVFKDTSIDSEAA